MYKISIIIPIFNVEKYIEHSLNSILNQTMNQKDIEVIMIDDCSTDNSRNIVKKYEAKYPNFKAICHDKNSGGAAIPRNSGLNAAKGKYIMFLDPDDEFSPDMCETLYNKIAEKNVDMVRCNYEVIYPTRSRLDYSYPEYINELEINCNKELLPHRVSVCNAIRKKSFLDKNNIKFENLKSTEDLLFTVTEYVSTDKIIFLNQYHGYKYHIHDTTSHAMQPTNNKLDSVLLSFKMTKKILDKKNRPDIIHQILSIQSTNFFIRLMHYNGDKKEYLKKYYEFEKSLNKNLDLEFLWLKILNKMLLKKHFTLSVTYLNLMKNIRNSPLLKIYQKFS